MTQDRSDDAFLATRLCVIAAKIFDTFKYILLVILLYFWRSRIVNAELMFVMECFYIAVLRKDLNTSSTSVVWEQTSQGSEVDGMWSRSALMHLRRATCLSVHRKWGRMQGGLHTGRRFVVAPCQERTIVKSTRPCFLSEGTVYSCFVCNLRPLAPVPPPAGTPPHICLAALVFFR